MTVELFRWIRDTTSENGDVLPTIPKLAGRFGVAPSSIREALQTLSALGLVREGEGNRLVTTIPSLVRKVDGLLLWLTAASTELQVKEALRSWLELKWLLAASALEEFARSGPAGRVREVVEPFDTMSLIANDRNAKVDVVNEELSAYWRAAHLVDRPGLQALANSIAGPVSQMKPMWERLIDPSLARERAARLKELVLERSPGRVRAEIAELQAKEWGSWQKRLVWARQRRAVSLCGMRDEDVDDLMGMQNGASLEHHPRKTVDAAPDDASGAAEPAATQPDEFRESDTSDDSHEVGGVVELERHDPPDPQLDAAPERSEPVQADSDPRPPNPTSGSSSRVFTAAILLAQWAAAWVAWLARITDSFAGTTVG